MIGVTLLYNKSNPFGISKDVEAIVKALGKAGGYQIRKSDPLEPPVMTDLAIHLEVPVYGWMPWALRNVLVVNPEWFVEAAWTEYLPRFDAVLFKDSVARDDFLKRGLVTEAQAGLVPWGCLPPPEPTKKAPKGTADTGFVWFLGGSRNKRAAVPAVVRMWRETYPPLRIYTTEALDLSGVAVPANVRVEVRDLDADTRASLGRFFRGHVCCSAAEGFGYTAAEAEWFGAFTILNDLPVYTESYADLSGVHILPGLFSLQCQPEPLAAIMTAFEGCDFEALAQQRRGRAQQRWEEFQTAFCRELTRIGGLKRGKEVVPPVLAAADCPPISVVTLLYNRRKFFDLACHSLMIQDYPKDKIEWILVEDSDDPMEDASDRVMAVAEKAAPVKVVYVPLKKKTPIGQKRNIGCERATADIILMMDDDDHYPETSFRRRVGWLTRHPWKPRCVAATTIACYDLVRGISAVNVPPMDLPLSQRISEATLTFWKRDWAAGGGFPKDVQVGEGEGFLGSMKASEALEIPPQQILVAFSHGRNASSRRVPAGDDLKPGCFWGFPREFLEFIHGLAGVKVVAEKS